MTTVDPVLNAVPGANHENAVPVRLGSRVAGALRELATDTGAPLDAAVVAGVQVLLARLRGTPEVVVGLPLPCSPAAFPVRGDLSDGPVYRELVGRVAATLAEAGSHAGDLDALGADLKEASGGRPEPDAVVELLRPGASGAGSTLAKADAAWRLTLSDGTPDLSGELRTGSAHPDETARVAAMLEHLIGELVAAPGRKVLSVSPVPPTERTRLLHGLNPARDPEPTHVTMAQLFEEQVRRTPDATAVVDENDDRLTYAELNVRANRLAHELRALGARPGGFVAVTMPRSIDVMVALYAVTKSGAAYVPVDPDLPDSRMQFMLEDSAPLAVLTDAGTRPRVPAGRWQTLAVDADATRWASRPAEDPPPLEGNHLIHLLYTSGTTGRPKAVAYPVDGALADIAWLHRSYPYGPGDTALFKTSYGFDVSIWEIFWPLFHGARVAICPPEAHRDPAALRDAVDRFRVTTMFMVPSMAAPFYSCTSAGSCPSLRWVFCGGEAVTPRVRDGFHERFSARIINCYGPTELGCVTETVLPVEPGAPVPVGPPVEHRRVYVLDEWLEPVPVGVPAELYVGGRVGIAQSYHRRPGLTAERFPADPFGAPGSRMYRTGDLVRYRADGVLEHLGRIGRQVKIRGVRIEPAEIEAVLAEHPDVAQSVVTVIPDTDGEIAAFVVPADGARPSAEELLSQGRRLLPAHMVPTTVTVLDAVPTLVNGKTDVETLLTLIDRGAPSGRTGVEPPATATEARTVALFASVLQLDEVGATDGFFELGGHSLLVFRLVELCGAEFGVDLAVRDVLRTLTPRGLATLVDAHPDTEGAR